MSFLAIICIVLLAVIILGFTFAAFHIIFLLLPAVLVIAVIIWLINHFTNHDKTDETPNEKGTWQNWSNNENSYPKRKKVRDAETKDVDK
ncbi:hypothetical protein [Lactobacillus sp. ESL0228]|uniref:hypothetical protein n=1 Tax=Lactobacillus sp. ESL0228 TaxID=2069352 RepID=UPI000EFAF162|nr:hypothetical protein [Lactobacillus sp. ESL0228]RMC49686.1 hypothetical protein F5ESL0228_02895 [Lactobacillus sp. ESL0228]